MESMFGHHISAQYNEELEDLRNRVLNMGGLVEQQIADAVTALVDGDGERCELVINRDVNVNSMEVEIDEECTRVLARRQPAAGDLRLIVAIIKTITDLERIGDQAEKVARIGLHLMEMERPKNRYMEIYNLGEHVRLMMHNTLDVFARLDPEAALQVTREDKNIDDEYEGVMRQMVTYMMEDPRTIRRSLDIMWSLRALERIGDHSKNICEYVIYLVNGKDVRHLSLEQMENAVRARQTRAGSGKQGQ
ncbi:MAG: phosphate signaling complex protein PhoU [Gammaproteobacteria bacterium]|nr:phosphate signaling complex protein PhoU [Gammaproteobacteria bacterium]